MKNNLRRMNLIFRFSQFKPENFYTISYTESAISFQGYYCPKTLKVAIKLKMKMEIDANGYVNFYRNNLNIILT